MFIVQQPHLVNPLVSNAPCFFFSFSFFLVFYKNICSRKALFCDVFFLYLCWESLKNTLEEICFSQSYRPTAHQYLQTTVRLPMLLSSSKSCSLSLSVLSECLLSVIWHCTRQRRHSDRRLSCLQNFDWVKELYYIVSLLLLSFWNPGIVLFYGLLIFLANAAFVHSF